MNFVRIIALVAVAFAALSSHPPALHAKSRVRIKLATLAPKGTKWTDSIDRMGRRWKEVSNGQVQLKVYPGGVAGDESDMVRKMRVGQLQAATITSIGLGSIDRSSIALTIPMLFQSYEELDYVRDRLGPKIAANLEEKGFVLLEWGEAGWVHFFSESKAVTPAAVQALKLYVWTGDPVAEAAWRSAGFDVVPTSSSDVIQGLQTGRLQAFATVPLYALASQWFGLAKHMTAIKWAPLSGATVVTKKAWSKIEPDLQGKLQAIAAEESQRSRSEIRAIGDKAIQAMVDRGLTVHRPDPATIEQWRTVAQKAYPRIRDDVLPEGYFDEVEALLAEFRKSKQ